MKFITGIKKIVISSKTALRIPLFHRTSISFYKNSEVYYITRVYEVNKVKYRELILTPLIPDSWHRLRKITINTYETPGVINLITSKLRDLKVNVNVQEALTTNNCQTHTITLIVDLTYHLKENNYNIDSSVPKPVIDRIEKELKSLTKPSTTEPVIKDSQLTISKLNYLESISSIPENCNSNYISTIQFRHCKEQKSLNKEGKIELTGEILRALDISSNEENIYFSMFSETEEKYIKINFFDPNQSVAFIDVHHEDIYGAISKFTDIIYKDFHYNIIASYSHQQMEKNIAHWYALIDLGSQRKEFFTTTLNALKSATYGDGDFRTLNVFLIETNIDINSLDKSLLLEFGQNRVLKDGSMTNVYLKKREILKKILRDKVGLSLYKKSYATFIKQNGLQNTDSTASLLKSILQEKRRKTTDRIFKFSVWALSFTIPLSILFILSQTFPNIKLSLLHSTEHFKDVSIPLLAILLGLIIKFLLENNIEKFSRLRSK